MNSSRSWTYRTAIPWIAVYRWIIVGLGAMICASTVFQVAGNGTEFRLWILVALTALVASRVSVKIPRFNGTITFSDVFIFLALLTWGLNGAILAAVAEAIASSIGISRKATTYFFNIGLSATATWITGHLLWTLYGDPSTIAARLSNADFILAIGVMALSQYIASTSLVAVMQALKLELSLWRAWRKYYLWVSATFIMAAIPAGFVARYFGDFSSMALLTIVPVIGLIYFSYETYIRNLDALQESEQLFRSSFDYASVGMALVSPDGKWLQINESLCGLLQAKEDELLNSDYKNVVHSGDLSYLQNQLEDLMAGKITSCQNELRLISSRGDVSWVDLSVSTARDAHNNIRHLVFQAQNVTSRKQAEEQLIHDASHDSLTGLLNRTAFREKLDAALINVRKTPERITAVLFLDLDGFKLVNDSMGHSVGDNLLNITAQKLLECVRGKDTVARLGGDEFTVLLENLTDIGQAVHVAERINLKLSESFFLGGQEIFVGASIGVASSLIPYENAGDMLRDADAAMYQAKAVGKGCYVFFDNEMHDKVTRELRLANDLRGAVKRGELFATYQVIRNVETGDIWGFEALVRWDHPLYGVLPPNEFIPLAEENVLIDQLDDWVLSEACRQLKFWKDNEPGAANCSISVNISSKRFTQRDLVEKVARVLEETGLEPHSLQIEITESAMMKNLRNTAHTLAELSRMGVQIALDDFGTGYSSLSYLQEFPISTLKIDRSFVQRMGSQNDSSQIVRAVVTLARSLKMKVIAEGVESESQLKQLKDVGCQYCQGYLFSAPIVADDAFKLVSEHLAIFTPPRSKNYGLRLTSNL
ncbi:MAG TPA: EAL domain-containing protein [Pyrinomonadaceae bacterium]|nr:EAL domain-containing protein [Pyrinomonadaceae bacterium]